MVEDASIMCLCDIGFAGFIITSLGLFSFKFPLIVRNVQYCGIRRAEKGETSRISSEATNIFIKRQK